MLHIRRHGLPELKKQVHKLVKFRPRGMIDKREMEQAQLFETADERGCTPMFGAAHRR